MTYMIQKMSRTISVKLRAICASYFYQSYMHVVLLMDVTLKISDTPFAVCRLPYFYFYF
jgi:hypothetical protein